MSKAKPERLGGEHCAPWAKKADPNGPPPGLPPAPRRREPATTPAPEPPLPGAEFAPELGGQILFVGGCADGQLIRVPRNTYHYRVAAPLPAPSAYIRAEDWADFMRQEAREVSSYALANVALADDEGIGGCWFCMLEEGLSTTGLFRRLIRYYATGRDGQRGASGLR